MIALNPNPEPQAPWTARSLLPLSVGGSLLPGWRRCHLHRALDAVAGPAPGAGGQRGRPGACGRCVPRSRLHWQSGSRLPQSKVIACGGDGPAVTDSEPQAPWTARSLLPLSVGGSLLPGWRQRHLHRALDPVARRAPGAGGHGGRPGACGRCVPRSRLHWQSGSRLPQSKVIACGGDGRAVTVCADAMAVPNRPSHAQR